MSTPELPTPISPTPAEADWLINALGDSNHALSDIADVFGCPTESLALWMALPEIAARLSATDSIATWRTRLCAQAQLIKVVAACSNLLDHFNADPSYPLDTPSAAHSSKHPDSDLPHRAFLMYLRRAESARKAATLLLRLSKLSETTRTQREPDTRATDAAAPSRASAVPSTRHDNQPPAIDDAALRMRADAPATPLDREDRTTAENSPTRTESRATEDADPSHFGAVHPPRHVRPEHPHSCPNPAPNRNPNLRASSPSLLVTAGPSSSHEHWP